MNSSLILYLFVGVVAFFFGFSPPVLAVSFSILNPQVNNEEVTFDVSISGLSSNSCTSDTNRCYLQAAFTSSLSNPRYFGFTKNNQGQWYEYDGSPPDKTYIQTNFFGFPPESGNWSGQLTIKSNPADPDYNGPGTYNIKAWRYSGNSTSYSGSSDNTLTVEFIGPTSTPTPAPASTPTPPTAPTATKTPTPVKTPTPTPKSSSSGGSAATATPKPTSPPTSAQTKILALSSQAAGGSGNINTAVSPIATSSSTPIKSGPIKKPTPTITTAILGVAQNNLSKILIGVGIIFLAVCGIIAFRSFRKGKNDENH